MPSDASKGGSPASEAAHALALAAAALALAAGVLMRNPPWVKLGVSLILLLPPLRLATTILGEVQARRFRIALLGVSVLAFLILSQWIS